MSSESCRHIETIERNVRRIHYLLARRTKPLIRRFGLTSSRFHLLLAVYRNGPLHMRELHRHTHVTGSTVTSLVDGLEEAGFLTRYRTPQDRRRVYVRVTDRGESCINEVRAGRCALIEAAMASLPDTERIAVANTLRHLGDRLQETDEREENRPCDR